MLASLRLKYCISTYRKIVHKLWFLTLVICIWKIILMIGTQEFLIVLCWWEVVACRLACLLNYSTVVHLFPQFGIYLREIKWFNELCVNSVSVFHVPASALFWTLPSHIWCSGFLEKKKLPRIPVDSAAHQILIAEFKFAAYVYSICCYIYWYDIIQCLLVKIR